MNKRKINISINLLTWNGEKYLPWVLKSLNEQSFKGWDLLVLDNASSDKSLEIIKEYCPSAKIIKQKENIGFARGHNLLINWSSSDYILVLNQDIILDKDYLKKIIKFLEENPLVASAAGKTMYWDFNKGKKSKIIDSWGFKIDKKRKIVDWNQGKKDYDLENKEVFGLSGAVVVYRRRNLENIKELKDNSFQYFDEDFFTYKEDIDLSWRLRLNGWENYLITNTKAYHHRTISLKIDRKLRGSINKISYRNHLMLLYKISFFRNFIKDFFYIFWYEFKKIIYFLIYERSTLVGLKDFIKAIPSLRKKRKFIKKLRKVKAEEMYKWFK